MPDVRPERVRDLYRALASADRDGIEVTLADDVRFSRPLDVGLDRHGYLERGSPGAGGGEEFESVWLVEAGDEGIVTSEMKRPTEARAATPRS